MYGVFDNEYTAEEVDDYLNGGPPSSAHDGMAWGQNPYGHIFGGKSNVKVLGKTWQWKVGYAAKLWGAWVGNQVKRVERNGADGPADGPADVPALVVREGEVWMPNLMVHAVKSNPKRVDNGPG